MTLGELKYLDWLKFDKNAVDILVLLTKPFVCDWLDSLKISYNYDDDLNELVNLLKQATEDKKMYWEFVQFGGANYIDLGATGFDGFEDGDDYIVDEFNITSYKVPTIIIREE